MLVPTVGAMSGLASAVNRAAGAGTSLVGGGVDDADAGRSHRTRLAGADGSETAEPRGCRSNTEQSALATRTPRKPDAVPGAEGGGADVAALFVVEGAGLEEPEDPPGGVLPSPALGVQPARMAARIIKSALT